MGEEVGEDGEDVGEHVPDPLLLTLTDVAGSAELATQTALDLLLNMSTQRELATGSLQVRRAEGGLCLPGHGRGRLPCPPQSLHSAQPCSASGGVLQSLAFLRLSCCPPCRWQW